MNTTSGGEIISQYRVGLFMAILTAICWAILAIGLKYALSFAHSGSIAWIRLAVAFVLLLLWLGWRNPQNWRILKDWPWLAVLGGVCLAINYWAYMVGLEFTNASNAQIMIQSGPLLLILIGIFFFKERLSKIQTLGFAIALSGFALFFFDQLQFVIGHAEQYLRGNLLIYLGGLCWALYATFQKLLYSRYSPQQINLLVYALSSLLLLPAVSWSDFGQLSFFNWGILFLLGVNTLLAYGAFGESLKRIPASHASLIITINPLGSILIIQLMEGLSLKWFKPEPLHWSGYLGAGLVVTGVVLALSKSSTSTKGDTP